MPRKAQAESIADADAAPGGAAAVDRALSLLAAFRQGDKSLTLSTPAESRAANRIRTRAAPLDRR